MVPEFRGDEDFGAWDGGCADAAADFGLVGVDGGGVDVAVAGE